MTEPTQTLRELVEVLNDGQKFYEAAVTAVSEEPYRRLFQRMATLKREHAAALGRVLRAQGAAVPTGGTVSGSLHQVYGVLASKLSSTPANVFVGQLEDAEDRILHAFEKATTSLTEAAARAEVSDLLIAARREHEEMRALKHEGMRQAA